MKPEAAYAYMSHSQLSSRREPGGCGGTFDAKEVKTIPLLNAGARRESGRLPLRRSTSSS
ncbi:hypothetical protein ACFZDP_49960 [Streptomyces mirabilis]|uniref:hypothetical protein n=1 Tax=Streptomyces mirabilis TaxID=68239 RepID=UPI0036E7FBCF